MAGRLILRQCWLRCFLHGLGSCRFEAFDLCLLLTLPGIVEHDGNDFTSFTRRDELPIEGWARGNVVGATNGVLGVSDHALKTIRVRHFAVLRGAGLTGAGEEELLLGRNLTRRIDGRFGRQELEFEVPVPAVLVLVRLESGRGDSHWLAAFLWKRDGGVDPGCADGDTEWISKHWCYMFWFGIGPLYQRFDNWGCRKG